MTNSPTLGGRSPNLRRRLLEAAQRGDSRAQEELVRRYEPLVQRVVWALTPPRGCEREDLVQEARMGLLAAIRAWRPERGPFPALADRCVRNQALLAVKAARRHKQQILSHAISLEEPAPTPTQLAGDRPPLRLIDRLAAAPDAQTDPESRLLVREQLSSVLRAIPTLTAGEQAALARSLTGNDDRPQPPNAGPSQAACKAAYRARRKLTAAVDRAA